LLKQDLFVYGLFRMHAVSFAFAAS
jgi:hypothetical protein